MQEQEPIREFDSIYQQYHQDIFRFLMKLTNYNTQLAEELTQETFYQVYLGIDRFKGKCHVKTWICQIAKNTYYLYNRKNKRIAALNDSQFGFDNQTVYKTSSILSTEETYEKKEMIGMLIKIIDTFKEVNHDVMIYRIFFDMPYSEISRLLGISEASAKVIYHRCRIILQNKLREEYGHEI